MSLKIVSLVGARPQFIKEAVICEQLEKNGIKEVLVNSGQHYDKNMSDVFFSSLNIKSPAYNLNVGSGKHGEMTAKIMVEFEKVLEKEKPDMVLVYGDTNTTLAGAVVASKMKIKLGHIEAGIRMEPKNMPEEINRVMVDSVSDLMFCPSQKAVQNLKLEGKIEGVHFVGDVMYDLYLKMESFFKDDICRRYGLKPLEYCVVTIHRDYNVDDKGNLEKILSELNLVNKDLRVVFPIHPRTIKKIKEFNLEGKIKELLVIEPLGYLEMMGLVRNSRFVITDSGGLQKESYFSGKKAIVLMPDTGWVELVEEGINILCKDNNFSEKINLFDDCFLHTKLYGEGTSGGVIAGICLKKF
jgi:UDP-N-acetylglucosamine 2-epimerase (non-hydrolysing)